MGLLNQGPIITLPEGNIVPIRTPIIFFSEIFSLLFHVYDTIISLFTMK